MSAAQHFCTDHTAGNCAGSGRALLLFSPQGLVPTSGTGSHLRDCPNICCFVQASHQTCFMLLASSPSHLPFKRSVGQSYCQDMTWWVSLRRDQARLWRLGCLHCSISKHRRKQVLQQVGCSQALFVSCFHERFPRITKVFVTRLHAPVLQTTL